MSKYHGTLRKNELEGGFFELHADDGIIYRLEGKVSGKDGDRVEISGEVAAGGGFGIHMTGSPALKVSAIKPA